MKNKPMLVIFTILCLLALAIPGHGAPPIAQQIDSAIKSKILPRHPVYKSDARALLVAEILHAAALYGLDPFLLTAMCYHENSFRSEPTGPAGEIGPIQVHPRTARRYNCRTGTRRDLLLCGARILRTQIDKCDGDVRKGLGAYGSKTGLCNSIKKPVIRAFVDRRFRLADQFRKL